MTNPSRVQAGVPAGGQFTESVHGEPGMTLTAPPAPRVTISQCGVEDGDSAELDHTPINHGGIFTRAEVINSGGQFRAVAEVPVNMTEVCPELDGDEADDYLNDHNQEIVDYLGRNYGAELTGGDEWSQQGVEFTVPVDPDADDGDEIVARLEDHDNAIRLHNELNGGFGHRSFFPTLRDHLDKLELEREEAAAAIADQDWLDYDTDPVTTDEIERRRRNRAWTRVDGTERSSAEAVPDFRSMPGTEYLNESTGGRITRIAAGPGRGRWVMTRPDGVQQTSDTLDDSRRVFEAHMHHGPIIGSAPSADHLPMNIVERPRGSR